MKLIRRLLNKYVYQIWYIAIADIGNDLEPKNIKWMKHDYKDRWFADPFIIDETEHHYIVLAEEFIYATRLGRLARLTIDKDTCRLVKNETILDLSTHLSFPNPIIVDGQKYVYPENAKSGNTKVYKYGQDLKQCGILSDFPLADATITEIDGAHFLFATVGKDCNGNVLNVYRSKTPLSGYTLTQSIEFDDNIARRAGNVFNWKGKMISPAQVCNKDYGEGVSFQELTAINGRVTLKEIKRLPPPTKLYPEGFHTYNVFKDKVIIDGYKFGSKFLHDLYFKIRTRK